MTAAMKHLVFPAGEGTQSFSGLGAQLVFKATGEDTDGTFAFYEYTAPPQYGGPPPHLHAHMDEVFYVLDGELQCTLGEQTITAGAGAFVFIPRGVPHTFANPAAMPVRFLGLYTPAGFERYFVDLAAALPVEGGYPDAETMRAITAKYDIVSVGAPSH